ncbi:glycosyltransferase family 4 protein [Vibrio atlanticus]|uniref:glycosyltransferase family 4 protein n=1 Tax=Vibrio atlanticus TaxID=693153 RepID=UPI00354FB7C2
MIIYDGIVESIQRQGGVSVVFKELVSRNFDFRYISYVDNSNISARDEKCRLRFFERYRDVCLRGSLNNSIFHSTYYRLCKNDIPTVTTVHDFTYEKFVRGPAKWVHCWQKYRAIKNSDIVICVSENTAKDLMKYCPVSREKIRVIYNGVSESYYPIIPQLQQTKEVLFVGARGGYKNFDLAVKVLSNLPSFSLSIVGGGVLSQSEIKNLEAHIPNRYQWLGRLSDSELNEAYNRSYALLYPSSYEGFGIPVIEAMKAGCPVVAVNKSSIPEVAGDAALLVEEPTIPSLTSALICVDSQRNEMVCKGMKQASKFSWDKCFENTNAVYEELI